MKPALLLTLFLTPMGALCAIDAGLAIHKTEHGLSVTVKGKPFASYVIDEANKPYLWPIYGPTGKQMTRAYPMQDVPGETVQQRDHPHHRGLTFGHESIGGDTWKAPKEWGSLTGDQKPAGGGNTWGDQFSLDQLSRNPKYAVMAKQHLSMLGSIKHREFTTLMVDASEAIVAELCDYLDPSGKRYLTEKRRLTFRATAETRTIDIDQDFTSDDGDVRFDDTKEGGLSIRVPASMAVDENQGGEIVDSDGLTNKDAWGKPAKWCDYHGPVDGEQLGIAFLNHPGSYRYPTRWHVRTYGLFAANPFAQMQYDQTLVDGTTTLKAGQHLKLRHRFLFHRGNEKDAKIEEAWQQYSRETPWLP